ncbi:MAG: hypothetical protein ABL999_02615 [Pyrinomonadaceae bacterium]
MFVAYVIAFPFVYFANDIIALGGYSSFPVASLTGKSLMSLVLAGIILVVLTPLNRRLLDWRKSRGRDIEDEERYESDHGLISLTPKDKD